MCVTCVSHVCHMCVTCMQRGDKLVEYDDKKERALSRDDIKCPEGWLWKEEWKIDVNRAVDEDGGLQKECHRSCDYHVIRLGVCCGGGASSVGTV